GQEARAPNLWDTRQSIRWASNREILSPFRITEGLNGIPARVCEAECDRSEVCWRGIETVRSVILEDHARRWPPHDGAKNSPRTEADEKLVAGTWRRERFSFLPNTTRTSLRSHPPPGGAMKEKCKHGHNRRERTRALGAVNRALDAFDQSHRLARAGNLSAAERAVRLAERQAKLAAQLLDLKASLRRIALARTESERAVRAERSEARRVRKV